MDTQEIAARSGARRLSWAESERAILDALDALGAVALAARMAGQPINRSGLQTQLTGLQRLLADGGRDHERTP